ncbi:uncharacterized protein LOC108682079 [Hyalella azteca]|uniref:Uncharacterized protein LOC108682079 n=1 Tax=Hyalella azteca TaxID=294128 RepID=A0A8B7PMN7_HYAAZ|nr:uncharacterized protein LOC108682079 [Hyalella azteca]
MDISSRKRLMPTEKQVQEALAEEIRKQRVSRIQQVRQQANELTASHRQAVEQARQEEISRLRQDVIKQWQQQQNEKLLILQKELDEAINSIGEAHRAAQEKVVAAEAEAAHRQLLQQRAEARGVKALQAERCRRQQLQDEHQKQARLRTQVKAAEQQRALRVARLPLPPSLQPPPPRVAAPEPPPVLVQEAGTLVMSHYRPKQPLVSRHACVPTEEDNAWARAQAERERVEQQREEKQREEAEKERRVAERGRLAEEKQKLIEMRERLTRLMNRDDLHAFYRGEDVICILSEEFHTNNRREHESISQDRHLISSEQQAPSAASSGPQMCDITHMNSRGVSDVESATGISGMESASGISGMESVSGISGMESANGISGMESAGGISGMESAGGINGIIVPENAGVINGTESSDYSGGTRHTGGSSSENNNNVDNVCEGDRDGSKAATTTSATAGTEVTSNAAVGSYEDGGRSGDLRSPEFDAKAALQQAEDLMARVREMKLQRDLMIAWPPRSNTATSSDECTIDSSGSWRTVEDSPSEGDPVNTHPAKKSALKFTDPRIRAARQQTIQNLREPSLDETNNEKTKKSLADSSSFDEQFRVLLKFNEGCGTVSDLTTTPTSEHVDDNLEKSLHYIEEMKNSLGIEHSVTFENSESTHSSSLMQDQISRNLQLLKRNRENIDKKLGATMRARNTQARKFQNIRNRKRGDNAELPHPTELKPGSSTSDSSARVPLHLPGPSSSGILRTERPHPNPFSGTGTCGSLASVEDSPPVSEPTSVLSGSVCSVTTPARIYTEKLKNDGSGARPLRKRDKFELQKKILLHNYVKRLLDTHQSDFGALSSTSVESSGIDLSSVRVLARLAGRNVIVDSQSSSSDSHAGDRGIGRVPITDEAGSPALPREETHHLGSDFIDELDRVPSRLSDIEELSRRDISVQVPSARSSFRGHKNTRSLAVQFPSSGSPLSSVADQRAHVPGSISTSGTPSIQLSQELKNIHEQVNHDHVSLPSSVEHISGSQTHGNLFSNSSVTLPIFPSSSTPTMGVGGGKIEGAVSSNVSPIVADDAISTVDQVSSDQLHFDNLTDRPQSSFGDAGFQRQEATRNYDDDIKPSTKSDNPTGRSIPPGSRDVSAASKDVPNWRTSYDSKESFDTDMLSSSAMGSEEFSEYSSEELQVRKEVIEKKKAIYMRLLEINELKRQYLKLQQENEPTRNDVISETMEHAEIRTREYENSKSDEPSARTKSGELVQLGSQASDRDDMLTQNNPVSVDLSSGAQSIPNEPSFFNELQNRLECLNLEQERLRQCLREHYTHTRKIPSQKDEGTSSQSIKAVKRTESHKSDNRRREPYYEMKSSASSTSKRDQSVHPVSRRVPNVSPEESSREWATTEDSLELATLSKETSAESHQLQHSSPARFGSCLKEKVAGESVSNFTSTEMSEGLISSSSAFHHSRLIPELTQASSMSNAADASIEEGLLSNSKLSASCDFDDSKLAVNKSAPINESSRSVNNESFRKLMEIVDLRKLTGLSKHPLISRNESPVAEISSNITPDHTDGSVPLLDHVTESASSVNETSDIECYDADQSSRATSSVHSENDAVPVRLLLQQKRLEESLRSASASAATSGAGTTHSSSSDALGAELTSRSALQALVEGGSSSSSDLEELLKKFGWARGMLNKMNRIDLGYSSSTSADS